jgi:hypothetical protein
MKLIIDIFLGFLAFYAVFGLLFGLYFLFIGATKIDPLLANSKKGVRILLFPGVIATWPLFIKKAFKSKSVNS